MPPRPPNPGGSRAPGAWVAARGAAPPPAPHLPRAQAHLPPGLGGRGDQTQGSHMSDQTPYVGQSIPRANDRRLLVGAGRYVDDVPVPGCAHAVIVRSPHAHAIVRSSDVAAARALPGVVGVFTGAEI